MAGELFTRTAQLGKETTYGTAVAATRVAYLEDPVFTRTREPRPHRFATGTRDNVRAFTLGPEMAGGRFRMPLSSSEILEWLLTGIKGNVSPTTPNAGVYLWTFTPGTSLDSMTLELLDGAIARRMSGVYVDRLHFSGSANGPNMVEVELFGKAITANALTGALAQRTPDFLEGFETKIYAEAAGGTPGTTNLPGLLVSWDVDYRNNLGRKFTADDVNSANRAVIGEQSLTASFVFEASVAQAATEYANWDAATRRLVRLEFGQNLVIASTYKTFVTLDIPGAWSAVDLGQADQGTRVYQFSMEYVYDTVLAAGFQVRAQSNRSAAW